MINSFKVLSLILILSMSSCSAKKDSYLGKSKLVLSVEKRDYNSDRVTQTSLFENSLKQEIVTHDTNSKENLFSSKLTTFDSKKLEELKTYLSKLNKLDFENSFPWKEGLYDRGNVYKISFVATKQLEYIARKDKKDSAEVSYEKVLYYYQGHKESPQVFKDLVSFIESI